MVVPVCSAIAGLSDVALIADVIGATVAITVAIEPLMVIPVY